MSLTHANKIISVILFLSMCVVGEIYPKTSEIISNDMWTVTGSGDTVWILTSYGVNYTTNMFAPKIEWHGFKKLYAMGISYGAGRALLTLFPSGAQSRKNDIIIFNHKTLNIKNITIPFPTDKPVTVSGESKLPDFTLVGASWSFGHFWVSASDGGLLRLNEDGSNPIIFYPGIDSKAFSPVGLSLNEIKNIGDTANLAFNVAVEDKSDSLSKVWLLCTKSIWKFNPADTSWQKIKNIQNLSDYSDLKIKKTKLNTKAFVIARINRNSQIDTSLFVYDTKDSSWNKFVSSSSVTDVEFDFDNSVYVIQDNGVVKYTDTLPNNKLPHLSKDAQITNSVFYNRMLGNLQIDPELRDIYYNASLSDTMLLISSSKGLFFSDSVKAKELSESPFDFISRSVEIEAGLKTVYAVPGILTDGTSSEVLFAYNLSENDYVTIDIFDWNMDHVVRVVDDEFRLAGINSSNGRSSVDGKDVWNGTVSGRAVAPGVYYFRIKTRKEGRAFGKFIVALSR